MSLIAYLTFLSIIINLLTFIMLIVKGLGSSFERKFFIFNFALLCWQFEELLLRISVSSDVINFIDLYLSFFWIFLGVFLLDSIYEAKLLVTKHVFWIRVLFYSISMFFFITYISFPAPRIFLESKTFGLVLGFREGSLDILLRFWIAFVVIISLCIIAHALVVNVVNFRKLRLFFIGLLIPSIYGAIFQVYFPYMYGYEIPGATMFLSFFSLLSLVIFKDNFMFINFSNDNFNSLIDKINSIVFVFDKQGSIFHGNSSFKKCYPDIESIYSFQEGSNFLNSIAEFMGEGDEWNRTTMDKEMLISEERIGNEYYQFMCYPIQDENVIKGVVVFGLNVTKFVQARNSVMNSFKNFKRLNEIPNSYFLEIDIATKRVVFNDRFLHRFMLFNKSQYSYLELVLYLKKLIGKDDLMLIIALFRMDIDSVFERASKKIILEFQTPSVYFVFEISFKKFDPHVISNNHLIYLSDITDSSVESLKNDWVDKSTPWIVSHVFRKPVANIIGLMNIVSSEQSIFESRLSSIEIFSLINSEIKDLDSKIEIFSERNSEG